VDNSNIVGVLKQSQIFDGLGEGDLKKIAVGCIEQAFPMGTTIIEENDPPKKTLYFVKSGEMTITSSQVMEDGESTDESIITTLGAGDAFGEIALVDQEPHSATVRTISDSTIFLVSANFLDSLCEQDPRIGFIVYRNIAKLICKRLRLSNFSTKNFWIQD